MDDAAQDIGTRNRLFLQRRAAWRERARLRRLGGRPSTVAVVTTKEVRLNPMASQTLINKHRVRRFILTSGRWVKPEVVVVLNRQLVKQLEKLVRHPGNKTLSGDDVLASWPDAS